MEAQLIKTDQLLREKVSEVREVSNKINEMKRILLKEPINPELKLTSVRQSAEALIVEGGE